jgi:hypothetical protein
MMKNRFQFLHFPKPKRSCSHCRKEFEPEEAIYSSIMEDDDDQPVRLDCCVPCYEGIKDSLSDKARWRLIKPEEKVSKKLSWRELDERAFFLLDEALQNPSEEAKQEAALLALHLLRRKKIAIETEDHDAIVYRNVETGHVMTLPRASVPSSELQQALQRKLFSS